VAAGAVINRGTKVTGVIRRDGRAVGVTAVSPAGAAVEIPARLVVGADGVRSVVACAVGAVVSQRAAHASAMPYGHWSGLDTDGYEWCASVPLAPGADIEAMARRAFGRPRERVALRDRRSSGRPRLG
jgi:2-polyprenyl-6-methoxyphenol hydroxylase-like FAD-dependent oxidoreductase